MHALHKLLLIHVLTCLGRNAFGHEIINGEKVPENSMQYMVSVQNMNENHVCGGFLITEDFVVTAAHCFTPELARVVLGTHNRKMVDDEKIRYIEKKYIHPKYESEGTGNDIMLLKLSKKVLLSNNVQTIGLPTSEMNIRENQKCRVAGWGKTKSDGENVDELRMVGVSVINLEVCKKIWNGLPDRVICAGGYRTGKGFCQGDSGGPLVCNDMAVGIVSFNWSNDCNYATTTHNKPNVYTDISKYLPWIKSIVKSSQHEE